MRRLLRDLFELRNTVVIFRISPKEERGSQIKIHRYYGEAIRNYTRKKEREVIEKMLEILQRNDSLGILEGVSSLYSDSVKIYKRESLSGLQSMVVLSFKRGALRHVADVRMNVE